MPDRFNIPQDAYFNWPLFARQLRIVLSKRLDAEGVERVIAKTLRAYGTLHYPTFSASFADGDAEQALRREIVDQNQWAPRSKMLNALIERFIAEEAPKQ